MRANFQSHEVAESFAAAVRGEGYWTAVVRVYRTIRCEDGGWDFVSTLNNCIGYKVTWNR